MQTLSRPGLVSFAPLAAPISLGQQGLPNLLQILQGLGNQQGSGENVSDRQIEPPPPILLGPNEISALFRGGQRGGLGRGRGFGRGPFEFL